MTWLGINNPGEDFVWTPGGPVGDANNPGVDDTDLLVTGTLVIEAEIDASANVERSFVEYAEDRGWLRAFSVRLTVEGDLFVNMSQGSCLATGRVLGAVSVAASRIRISISWDAPRKFGIISVEDLDESTIQQAEFANPIPIPVGDLRHITAGTAGAWHGPAVKMVGLSDRIETVGCCPSILPGSLIKTKQGRKPIEKLSAGDFVLTHDGGFKPIQIILKKALPTCGFNTPMTLRAPYLGLVRNIMIAPHQRVVMAGSSAEYLFGQESVTVEARHLREHPSAIPAQVGPVATYYQIILDRPDNIELGGGWAGTTCLAERSNSYLHPATDPLSRFPEEAIPHHPVSSGKPLQYYETTSLLNAIGV